MRSAGIHRTIAVLLMPHHVQDEIKYGEHLQSRLSNNPHFPLPDPVLAAFDGALVNYSATETLAQTRAKGTIPARNAARVVYIGAAHAMVARVQQVADASPEQAEAIITSTGLAVKKKTIRQKQNFVVKYGATSGTVHVIAKAAATRAAYEWQFSVDSGKTWTSAPNTLQAKTTILGLPVATVVEFRYRATTKLGMGDWSQPTSILVK